MGCGGHEIFTTGKSPPCVFAQTQWEKCTVKTACAEMLMYEMCTVGERIQA